MTNLARTENNQGNGHFDCPLALMILGCPRRTKASWESVILTNPPKPTRQA